MDITPGFTIAGIEQRRNRVAALWNGLLKNDEAVLVYSGSPVQKPGGLDQVYPFLPHPSYYWLTGRRREDEVLLYNRNQGWTLFTKPFSEEQAVWENEPQDVLVQEPGLAVSGLDSWLQQQSFSALFKLGQSGEPVSGKAFELRTLLDRVRRVKDAEEVRLVKQVAVLATRGYRQIGEMLEPGISEKELALAYEYEIFRQGSHALPYDTLVGSGPNSSVLHALPSGKIIAENEFVLVDAGASLFGYCVDISRTYASSPGMSDRHKALYNLVLSVQEECLALCRPGIYWRDVHIHAAVRLTNGLRELGILKGDPDTLLEKEVIRLFFPHGIGHLFGLGVRDTGQEENPEPRLYFGSRLRVDIQLEEGHMLTVEPGLYLIDRLLDKTENRTLFRDDINWKELEYWKGLGGVRIEDNVLITGTGCENLTAGIEKRELL